MTPRLVLATANPAKVAEFRTLLDGLGYEVQSLQDYPAIVLPPEGETSYADNARVKARATARTTGAIALGDDSGLEVEALGGRPGVASARYGGPGLSDAARVRHLLAALAGAASRVARFRCVLALVAPWGAEATVEVQGTAEQTPFDLAQLTALLALARSGIERLLALQRRVLADRTTPVFTIP